MNTLRPNEVNEHTVQFCGCLMDSETQTLQTDTNFIRLRSKLWSVLLELVSKPNKLVSRETLIQHIWHGNCYTGEQGLTHAICHLRRILKKYQIGAKIVTLPKKGYILQVTPATSHPLNQVTTLTTSPSPINFGREIEGRHRALKYPASY
jgi:DNA-binding winged helix-turn-helix (wHTH) protein